jgi:cell division protein FtsB
MPENRPDKPTFPRLWIFVLLVLGAFVLGDLNERMADAHRLEQDARSLEEELTKLDEEIAVLKEDRARADTEAFIEEWARKEGKMVRVGEKLVIIVHPEGEEAGEVASSEDPSSREGNLELWLELILGG